MAYTDDAVQAKLSALNETQESIVTVAQWVMFHRRYADRTAASWLQRIKDSGSNKRLNLIYLANEVAQQSRMRKKDDFIVAFSPVSPHLHPSQIYLLTPRIGSIRSDRNGLQRRLIRNPAKGSTCSGGMEGSKDLRNFDTRSSGSSN